MGRRILVTALLLVVAGCTSARSLREAQDAFSRAAEQENAAFHRGYPTDVVDLAANPEAGYRLSLALVSRELAENEEALRSDRLYGTALMLKAYCLWRLGGAAGDESLDAVLGRVAAEREAIVLGERDAVMLEALPGLRDHELGLRAATYDEARRHFESALDVVDTAAGGLPAGSSLAVYLRLAMLSTCRAWQFAAYSFHADDLAKAKLEAQAPRAEAKRLFETLKPLEGGDAGLREAIALLRVRLGVLDIPPP